MMILHTISESKDYDIRLYRKELKRFIDYLESYGVVFPETKELLNMYSPSWVEEGDYIGGLKVSKAAI